MRVLYDAYGRIVSILENVNDREGLARQCELDTGQIEPLEHRVTLKKVADDIVARTILAQDRALRAGIKRDWIKQSRNSIYAEKKVKTRKGNEIIIRTYLGQKKKNLSYSRIFYNNKMSRNYFIVCDTKTGRKVYYKEVKT